MGCDAEKLGNPHLEKASGLCSALDLWFKGLGVLGLGVSGFGFGGLRFQGLGGACNPHG